MRNARDAALVAASRDRQQTDMGEAVGYRGRYDEEHQREVRIPSSSASMGYHQTLGAESSGRRRTAHNDDLAAINQSPSTESSADEAEAEISAPPVVDLLG